jgi:hypothetical protein
MRWSRREQHEAHVETLTDGSAWAVDFGTKLNETPDGGALTDVGGAAPIPTP